MHFDCVVVASHLRFDGVRQRPHHVVTRLGRRVPLLYVEEPFLSARETDDVAERDGIAIVRPLRSTLTAAPFDARTTAAVRAWVGDRSPLVWLYTPLGMPLADAFSGAPLVVDSMDDLAAFAHAPPGIAEREAAALARADWIFAGGRSLFDRARRFSGRVRLAPSGVEYEHFARAERERAHPLYARLGRPVVGYAGVVDERIEVSIVEALARRDVQVVVVGPIVKIDAAVLPRAANVHFTGQVAYAELPAFVAGFDVATLPFARNAATASISPTKTPEYLAAGKPVVSTSIADVVADYGDVVTFADDAESFADACLRARFDDPERRRRGRALAREATWDAVVGRMWNDLERE